MLRDLWFRARALLRRGAVEKELDEELGFHLDRQIEKHVAAGHGRAEAVRLARLELGGVHQVKEACRDARGVGAVEVTIQDVRYGLRQLRRSPGFTAVALVTLALGIGANTALFSVVNGVLLNPLPYDQPDELVILRQSKPNFATGTIPYLNFLDWQKHNRSFAAMGIYRSYGFNLSAGGTADVVNAQFVTSGLFPLLGVRPLLGRGFAPGEDEIGRPPVALISESLWSRKFDRSPDVLGRTIILDGRGYTVLGVMPAGLDVTLDRGPLELHDVWVPIGQWQNEYLLNRSAGLGIGGVGRLKPGVSLEQARADMERVTRDLAAAFPEANRGTGAALIPFKDWVVGGVRPVLLVLFGAVAIVLVIACVNVANLLLARATGRARELAIRVALGASRARLVRQLVTESLLLALAGGGLGLLVAGWATPAALGLLPETLPRAGEIGLDGSVLAFTFGLSIVCGLLFGLVPALKATDATLHPTLKDGGRGSGAHHRFQDALVAVQMAMVLVLLVGAGLMIRTLDRLWQVDPGFEPAGVSGFDVSYPPSMTKVEPTRTRAYLRELEARIKAIPGVDGVSPSNGAIPLRGDDERLFWKDGQPKPSDLTGMSWTLWYTVGPEYLRIMDIPLLRGRFLRPEDDERAPLVAVADEIFAREYFPGENPVGKKLRVEGYDRPVEIVGVVGHVVQWGLARDSIESLRAQLYFPLMQLREDDLPWSGVTMLVRSSGPPVSFEAVRAELQRMNPEQVASAPFTMEETIALSLARHRFAMFVFAALAGLALLLASVGIYGVISYAVGQRTAEIGIRMALGARRADVLGLVVRHVATVAAVGIGIGLAAALGLTRLMSHLLFGVSATDPFTFAAVVGALSAVAVLASYMPARRATRVDPMIALRHE
jgi:predicted permease